MSRQELYAWSSLASSVAVLGFYIIAVFGWPEDLGIPDYSARLTQIFINVFLFAFIVEVILGIADSKDGIEKDERDIKFEGKGYKNGYFFLCMGVTAIMFNSLFSGWFDFHPAAEFFSQSINTFHALFIALFLASIARRLTQVYYYRSGA